MDASIVDRWSHFDTEELCAFADLSLEKGDLESALDKLKAVVSRKDAPAQASAMLARLYAQLGLFEKAKGLFEAYLAEAPESQVERFQLGMVHFDLGDISAALEIWEKILESSPTNPPALFYAALAYVKNSHFADARRNLDVLLKSAPPDNLYFGRAKGLLADIEKSSPASGGAIKQDAPQYISG